MFNQNISEGTIKNILESCYGKLEEVEKLLEKMEEEDDVMNVYHNMA